MEVASKIGQARGMGQAKNGTCQKDGKGKRDWTGRLRIGTSKRDGKGKRD